MSTGNSPIKRLNNMQKNDSITPKVGEFIKQPIININGTIPEKQYSTPLKERLEQKFKEFYETQSPTLFRKRKSNQNSPSRNATFESEFKTVSPTKNNVEILTKPIATQELKHPSNKKLIHIKVSENSLYFSNNIRNIEKKQNVKLIMPKKEQ